MQSADGYYPISEHAAGMSDERIRELELQLAAANASIATLTATGIELTRGLTDAELRNKKLRRNARREESAFKNELAVAQSKRG